MKVRFLQWDWRESIDGNELNEALKQVFNGRNAPSTTFARFDGDAHLLVISSGPLTEDGATTIFKAQSEMDVEHDPLYVVVEVDPMTGIRIDSPPVKP